MVNRNLPNHRVQKFLLFGLTRAWKNIIINIMKAAIKAPGRDSISTHEMRFQFGRVLRAVRAGRSLTLTYRRKPLARIVPLKPDAAPSADDPVFRLEELAEPLGPLTNEQIDQAIYGQ
jgi:antitoxin (DNA-binding transcriptional repressor) of toxin-antitoxin stability system